MKYDRYKKVSTDPNTSFSLTWDQVPEGDRLLVKVNPFEPLSADISRSIYEEAQDLGRFLGIPDVDVQIG